MGCPDRANALTLTSPGAAIRLLSMGMHLEPDPSGGAEYNDNEMEEQDVERHVREVEAEREAGANPEPGSKPSFWRRLFGKKP